jgi:tripartite-type tricarboxylate transporter receptor subunit TctC
MNSSHGLNVLCMAALGIAGSASGQNYPSKVVRIVASEAGSAGDTVARAVAYGLTTSVGQQVIVDNRPGGVVAGEFAAKSPPDGYTVLSYGSNLWLLPLLRDHVPYDPVKDFAPVSATVRTVSILVVHPSLPVKSVRELIALARANPGKLNYASAIAGSSGHLSAELFKYMAGVNIERVPFRGTSSAINAVMSGEVQMIFVSLFSGMPHVKSGRLKALALASAKPSALAPGMPTVAASGLPGYEGGAVYGVLVPSGTPAGIINFLNQEIVRTLAKPDVKERFVAAGSEPIAGTPEQLGAMIRADIATVAKLVKATGIRDEVY